MAVARDLEWGDGEMWVKMYKPALIRGIHSEDLTYSTVTVVNNTALFTSNLFRADGKPCHTHTQKKSVT